VASSTLHHIYTVSSEIVEVVLTAPVSGRKCEGVVTYPCRDKADYSAGPYDYQWEVSLLSRFAGPRALVLLLWRADRNLLVWMAILILVLGLLPNATILATGLLVDALPDAVRDGIASDAGRHALLALGLVTAGFFAAGLGLALARLLCEVMNTRLMQAVSHTAGRAYLAPRHLTGLERPEVAGQLDATRDFERTGLHVQTAWALRIVVSMRIAGIGSAVILFGFAWWAPLVLIAGWSIANRGASRWMERGFAATRSEGGGQLRRSEYLRGLATGASAAKEVRIFGLSEWVVAEYTKAWLGAMSTVWRARRTNVRGLALGTIAVVGAHAVVFAALGWQASQGDLRVGALAVYGLAALGMGELGFLGEPQWRLGRAAALARQLLDLERRLGDRTEGDAATPDGDSGPASRPAPRPAPRPAAARGQPAEVRLEGVWFRYRGAAQPVLAGLDLHIPAGQSLAVVGLNGAGKTTLTKLICGLYAPEAGSVSIDGRDLRTVDPAQLQTRLGVIFQTFLRYELSLRENVGFGSSRLLDHPRELEAALRDAGGVDLLADLPAGWDTVLARGYPSSADLSGGQWQKVALARALTAVRGGAGLLILDEPTANLDVRAEAELFDRFLSLTRDTTTILVSHRLSSVRHVDRIVVLDGGRVVEDGNHDELMAAGGSYATMFTLQAQRFGDQATRGDSERDEDTVAGDAAHA
jgi:ATP-binding cassette, subfamily B, bacterial